MYQRSGASRPMTLLVLLAIGLGGFCALVGLFVLTILTLARNADSEAERWADERRRLP